MYLRHINLPILFLGLIIIANTPLYAQDVATYFVGKWKADSMITMHPEVRKIFEIAKQKYQAKYEVMVELRYDVYLHGFLSEIEFSTNNKMRAKYSEEYVEAKWTIKKDSLYIEGKIEDILLGSRKYKKINESSFILYSNADEGWQLSYKRVE